MSPEHQLHYILSASPEIIGNRAADLEAFRGALAEADADVQADPAEAMVAVRASMSGAISGEDLVTMWQDVDIGLGLDTELAELLVLKVNWILAQDIVNGERGHST